MADSRQQQLFANEREPTVWEAAAAADHWTAEVVFNRPLETGYHYLIPDPLREAVRPGCRVRVPFGKGNRLITGFCVARHWGAPVSRRLKQVEELLDAEPLLTDEMLNLTRWIAERYLCGWGQVLDAVVPAGVKSRAGTREITCYTAAEGVCTRLDDLRLPAKQRAVVAALCRAPEPLPADELSAAADCGVSPIRTLQSKGLIVPIRRRTDVVANNEPQPPAQPDLMLNEDQRRALHEIVTLLQAQEHATVLLHGVTGSGKTEVYIQALREVVSYGRQGIVLVPEISLTPQTIRRFRSRFTSVAVLHSHLSPSERHWHWEQIARGRVQVVVGARSAVFAPTPQLGMIIIDEEHETTFKQQTTPRYHAREVARERARALGIPLVLGSATPTLESFVRARRGLDRLISLPKRVEDRPLPPVVVVDVINDPQINKGQAIGRALESAMRRTLKEGGQVILFLNLRGFSTVLWCRQCGAGVECPDCNVTLTWHRDRKVVMCHHCEYQSLPPRQCPRCDSPALKYMGTGTQRLEHEVREKFAGYRALRMDSDSMRKPGSHDAALDAFRDGDVRILLGTQMIAKGLDFPNVTLVGVVDADTLLHQPDLRAGERTFQLIAQVAGRTGRGQLVGRVLVQTSSPDAAVIRAAAEHDYTKFAKLELQHRRELDLPPFSHLARVILRGQNAELVQSEARRITELCRSAVQDLKLDVKILGPAPAPLLKLRNHYRFHFRMQAHSVEPLQQLWHAVAAKLAPATDVELTIDIDPLDMR